MSSSYSLTADNRVHCVVTKRATWGGIKQTVDTDWKVVRWNETQRLIVFTSACLCEVAPAAVEYLGQAAGG
jgi:hypothetical protein